MDEDERALRKRGTQRSSITPHFIARAMVECTQTSAWLAAPTALTISKMHLRQVLAKLVIGR
jgi:hypothetical protein